MWQCEVETERGGMSKKEGRKKMLGFEEVRRGVRL
jgi:hypothetical protein